MNYDDQFLYKLIKKLNERMALVESRLGTVTTQITNITAAGEVRSGHGAPTGASPGTPGKLYYNLDNGVLYQQAADGTWSLL